MPLIPLKLPAGVYKNGTDLESSGRWRDSNLIRWEDGSLRPVGGWETRKATAFASAPRGLITWKDNSGNFHIAAGTHSHLYHLTADGTVADITPVGFNTGDVDAGENTGFGGSTYGTAFYGVKRPSDGAIDFAATTWDLDTWGEYLVGCADADGKLYEWQLDHATPTVAAAVTNAPTGNLGMIVTEERFIMLLGANSNPRKVQWCDREDNTVWTATAENEAGDFELQTTGRIMGAVRVRGRVLLVTDTDAHTATYQGPPYVYGFEKVGDACGAVSRKAMVAIDEGAFWMGARSFYHFNGSTASVVNCDVSDFVFKNINRDQISKTYAVHNSQYGELWWFYPSGTGVENDSYVKLDYRDGTWDVGTIDRTAAVDLGVFDSPIWVDSAGNVYNHERIGYQHGAETPFVESGPISLGNGDQVMKVNKLIPDELNQGDVEVSFKTRFYPNGNESEYGPYTTANPTSVRFTGRQVRMRVEAINNADFRVGVMRIEARAGGRR
jgi:hypothetical protein